MRQLYVRDGAHLKHTACVGGDEGECTEQNRPTVRIERRVRGKESGSAYTLSAKMVRGGGEGRREGEEDEETGARSDRRKGQDDGDGRGRIIFLLFSFLLCNSFFPNPNSLASRRRQSVSWASVVRHRKDAL